MTTDLTVITVQVQSGPQVVEVSGVGSPQVITAGQVGPRGIQGPDGPANALSIGTVDTLTSGSPATASLTGASPSQVLNLGIPEGPVGPQGPSVTLVDGGNF